MVHADRTVIVDLGGTKVLAALASNVYEGHVTQATTPTGSHIEFVQALTETIRSVHRTPNRVIVAAPGPVDTEIGALMEIANFSFTSIPLKQLLEAELGVSVEIVGDAEAGAVAEFGAGAARSCGARDGLYVTVSTGIGAGLVLDGRLRVHDGVGELGHVRVDAGDGIRCGCGGIGCLETYSSGSGVATQATLRSSKSPSLTEILVQRPLTAHDVFDAAKMGDQIARSVIDRGVTALATVVSGVIRTLAPEAVVLGGGFALGTGLRDSLERAVVQLNEGLRIRVTTRILRAEFERRSVLVGAALLADGGRPSRTNHVEPRRLADSAWGARIIQESK